MLVPEILLRAAEYSVTALFFSFLLCGISKIKDTEQEVLKMAGIMGILFSSFALFISIASYVFYLIRTRDLSPLRQFLRLWDVLR